MRRSSPFLVACAGLLCLAAIEGCSTTPLGPVFMPYTLVHAWGDSGSGPGQFRFPWDVALDRSGRVFMTDIGNHRVQVFDGAGAFLYQWGDSGSADGQFDSPLHLALDASGNVYVVDSRNHRIQKFASDGTYVAQWGSFGTGDGEFRWPVGVAVDAAGNVYVTDRGNDRVQKFTGSGSYLAQWGSPGSGDGQFDSPRGIAAHRHLPHPVGRGARAARMGQRTFGNRGGRRRQPLRGHSEHRPHPRICPTPRFRAARASVEDVGAGDRVSPPPLR